MEEPPTPTQHVEQRPRLMTLELETPPRLRGTSRRHRTANPVPRPTPSPTFLFKLLTIALLLCLFLMGIENSCHQGVTAQYTQLEDSFTNSKIFHHNRTSPAALAFAQPNPSKSYEKIKKNKKSAVGGGGSVTSTSDQKPKPHKPSSVQTNLNINNVNNYFKTAINFLNMGLGVTTPKSTKWSQRPSYPKFRNTSVSARDTTVLSAVPTLQSPFHPFSVLKKDMIITDSMSIDSTTKTPSTNIKGRSNFEFEPLFESSFEKGNGTSLSSKNLNSDFFDKFEDHWNDPDAQESVASFAVINPKFHHPPSGPMSRPSGVEKLSVGGGDFSSGGTENYYVNQKNVNYWPTKLNSYYGSQYPGPSYTRPLGNTQGHIQHNSFDGQGSSHYDGTKEQQQLDFENYDTRPSGLSPSQATLSYKKDTIIDRVSVFYSEYKILAWGIIIALAALTTFGVVLGLYFRNPPTEVVTARQKLTEAINDPQLMTFMKSLFSSPTSRRRAHSSSTTRRLRVRSKRRKRTKEN